MSAIVSQEHARTTWLTGAAGLLLLAAAFIMMAWTRPAPHPDPASPAAASPAAASPAASSPVPADQLLSQLRAVPPAPPAPPVPPRP
jgi:HAMP domain-containing protein